MKQRTKVVGNKNARKNNVIVGFVYTKKEGITLISLVITIIVLLILATVAISIAIDSDGLFTRARKAAEDWNTSVADEEKTIENVFEILNKVNVGGTVGGGETDIQTGANVPAIPEGANFQYVTWEEKDGQSGTYEEVLTESSKGAPNDWYNYDEKEKKWANIKTTSNDGTNEAYWVWIPRYAYKVPEKPIASTYTQNPTFQIAFLQGNTNTPVNISDLEGETIKKAADIKDTGPSVGDWVVHPAFTFGDKELSRNMGSKI